MHTCMHTNTRIHIQTPAHIDTRTYRYQRFVVELAGVFTIALAIVLHVHLRAGIH